MVKEDIKSEWETTDLGEPSKIVGIEINDNAVTIHYQSHVWTARILYVFGSITRTQLHDRGGLRIEP